MTFNMLFTYLYLLIILTVNANSQNGYNEDDGKWLELIAISRNADLGQLYDYRTDQFLNASLFDTALDNTLVESEEKIDAGSSFFIGDSLVYKFQDWRISPDVQMSIMAGLIQLEGPSRFFKHDRISAKSAMGFIIKKFETSWEKISIWKEQFRTVINHDILANTNATHAVGFVEWGGIIILSIEDPNEEGVDQKIAQNNLNKIIEKFYNEKQLNEEETQKISELNFEIFGDIVPDQVPDSLIEAVNYTLYKLELHKLPNNALGYGRRYLLTEINYIRSKLNITGNVNTNFYKVDESTALKYASLFDNIEGEVLKLKDLVQDVLKFEKYISTKEINQVKNLHNNYSNYQDEINGNLTKHLVLYRSGAETIDVLKNNLVIAEEHDYSWLFIRDTLESKDYKILQKQIDFLKRMKSNNVTLLEKNETLEEFLNQYYENDIYLLFHNQEYPETPKNSMETFEKMIKNRDNYGHRALFCAVNMEMLGLNFEPRLSFYRYIKLIDNNFKMN